MRDKHATELHVDHCASFQLKRLNKLANLQNRVFRRNVECVFHDLSSNKKCRVLFAIRVRLIKHSISLIYKTKQN